MGFDLRTAGINAQGRAGLDALKSTTQSEAATVLAGLGALRKQNGSLRLLHTTDDSKTLKFKSAGSFKTFFLNKQKLSNTAQVVTDLLRRAGCPEDQVRNFQQYADARSRQRLGVEVSEVRRYAAMTLQNLVAGVKPDQSVGEGAFGKGYLVQAGDKQMFLKIFKSDSERTLPQIQLAKAHSPAPVLRGGQAAGEDEQERVNDGKIEQQRDLLGSEVSQEQHSVKDSASEFSRIGAQGEVRGVEEGREKSIRQPQPSEGKIGLSDDNDDDQDSGSIYDRKALEHFQHASYSFDSDEDEIESLRNSSKPLNGIENDDYEELFDEKFNRQQENDNVSYHQSIRSSSESSQYPDQNASRAGSLYIRQQALDPPPEPKRERPAALPAGPTKAGLARSGIGNNTRVKDIDQLVVPTRYLLEIEKNSKKTVEEMTGAQLKARAKAPHGFDPDATIRVIATLSPKAEGVVLAKENAATESAESTESAGTTLTLLTNEQLKQVAGSGLKLLKDMAAHGFVHGDIKGNNLIFDKEHGILRAIDTDNLQKISKHNNWADPEGAGTRTPLYAHPRLVSIANFRQVANPIGLGRDLYAFGAVLLEMSLEGSAREELQEKLAGVSWRTTGTLIAYLEAKKFPEDSVADFASKCMIAAILHEEGLAREGRQGFFDRWSAGNLGHPLNVLASHPALIPGS